MAKTFSFIKVIQTSTFDAIFTPQFQVLTLYYNLENVVKENDLQYFSPLLKLFVKHRIYLNTCKQFSTIIL